MAFTRPLLRCPLVKRFLVLAALALSLVAGAALAHRLWSRAALPDDPLAFVPADAYALVRVRVDRVLGSEAYRTLIVERGLASGIDEVRTKCGFDPLVGLRELVVFARPAPEGPLPRLAFAARGDLDQEALLGCAKKLAGDDGAALTREDVDGIPTVRSKKGSSRAAFVGRDGILGGDAESVRTAIHTLHGRAPSMASDPLLGGLYRELETTSDVQLLGRIPDVLKPLLRRVASTAAPELAALDEVRALSATIMTGAGRLSGGLLLIARDPPQASGLVSLAQDAKARLLAIPGIGLTPAASVLNGLQMEARGERATFAGSVKVSTADALLQLLPALETLAPSTNDAASTSTPGVDDRDAGAPTMQADAAPAHRPSRRSRRRTR